MTGDVNPAVGKANPIAVLGNVEYNVIDGPGDATALVQSARERVLEILMIEKLLAALDRTDDLLYIAACAVAGEVHPGAGKALTAEVMALQFELRKNTGGIPPALLRLGEAARNVLSILRGALKDLYDLYEEDAVTRLSRCAPIGREMAESAPELESDFAALVEKVTFVRNLTLEARSLHEQELRAAQQRQLELKARNERIKAARAALERQMAKIQELDEAAKPQNTADERMFAQATLADITKAVGSGIFAGLAPDPELHKADTGLAATYAQEKSKYLEMLMNFQQQEREALDAVADHAAELQSAKNPPELEQAAVVSLDHAVDYIRSIVAILQNHRDFWAQMAKTCARLEDDLRTDIERCMKGSREERITVYSKPDFQSRVLDLAAHLHALQLVASEYRAATMKLYDKMGETYRRNPSIEEARQLVPALGKALALDIAKDTSLLDGRTAKVTAAIERA